MTHFLFLFPPFLENIVVHWFAKVNNRLDFCVTVICFSLQLFAVVLFFKNIKNLGVFWRCFFFLPSSFLFFCTVNM